MNGDYSGLAPPNKIIGQLARCLLLFNRRCQFVIVYGAWRVLILYREKAWYQTFLVNTAKRKWSIARVTLTDIVTICLHVSFPITPQTTPTSHCYFLSRVPRQSRTTFINITLVYHLHPPFLSLSSYPWQLQKSFNSHGHLWPHLFISLSHTPLEKTAALLVAITQRTLLHPLNSFHALVSFSLSLPPLISPPSFVFKVEMPGSDDWQPKQP